MKSIVEALAEALASIPDPRVLWIDATPIEAVDAARGANRVSLETAGGTEPFDAVVLGPIAGEWLDAARGARARVRAGGIVAMIAPIEREGLRGATQRALASFDAKRKPRALELACTALLCAGVTSLRVIDLKGARGESLVWGAAAR